MAQTENGVGISWKLQDGTMIWARRNGWAELAEDIRIIKGADYLNGLESGLQAGKSVATPTPAPVAVQLTPAPVAVQLTPEQAAAELGGGDVSQETFQVCPACGALKDKLVPAGTSKRPPYKPYPAFYGCPTRGCPGK